jgi:nitroreductase
LDSDVMEIFSTIEGRRSIRRFKKEPIKDSLIYKIVSAGIWAPSAGNLQSWEVILVKDPEKKQKLSEAAFFRDFIAEAPTIIVLCANQQVSGAIYDERGLELYCIQDAACAAQNMLLATHALGLGACWVGAFDEQSVSDALSIPSFVRPVALLPIGYPNEKPFAPPRRDLDDFLHFNKY